MKVKIIATTIFHANRLYSAKFLVLPAWLLTQSNNKELVLLLNAINWDYLLLLNIPLLLPLPFTVGSWEVREVRMTQFHCFMRN